MSLIQPEKLPFFDHQLAQRPRNFIPIYEPSLGEREEALVVEAVRSGWISSQGKYINQFEQEFAEFCGVREGVAVCNGTIALHLALHALGIGAGDEVIVPTLTFVASANAVHYTGATPVFADVDPVTWNMDPASVERLITPRTRAIMPVHVYGHPAAMPELNALAQAHSLLIVEDSAEAHGAAIGTQRTGAFGQIAAFSFMANKIITTGEGGMLTTDDAALAARCRMLRDHAMPPERRYWHPEVGFNYRMTNLQAAVGVAQMARIDEFIERKRQIAQQYTTALTNLAGVTLPVELPGYTNVYWMYSVLIGQDYGLTRDELIPALRERGIDSRPFFHPLDTLPPYYSATPQPVALRLSQQGLNLPSAPSLTDEQVAYICDVLWELAK
ncbi:MAG: DegT/DnrJ/EryC1/StrS family aminotransferase [Chloroflexi bacterium]|nr:DegT/DnrJ/EryC1/StrS family aminotransferase [Chloroflexota bacterium]